MFLTNASRGIPDVASGRQTAKRLGTIGRTAGKRLKAMHPMDAPFKGNITRRGRIYHMPWSPWYGRTRIEPAKGERWFCNERQALDAGWRPALVR